MLKCERNTKAMQKKVLTAARKKFRQRKNIEAVFEHGQWWIVREGTGGLTEYYSVCDAEGPGSVNGFSFEMV